MLRLFIFSAHLTLAGKVVDYKIQYQQTFGAPSCSYYDPAANAENQHSTTRSNYIIVAV